MTPAEISNKMRSLSDFILDAETKVREGKIVDMSGIDRDVNVICSKAMALPADKSLEIQPLMAELIGHLERLGMALKDYKDNLKS
jgi:hypothetical protein